MRTLILDRAMAPFTCLHLDHVVIRARDAERLARFYCEVLGCAREREVAQAGLIQLRAGRSLIDILRDEAPRAGDSAARNMDHFCLRIEPFDGDAVLDYLERHGARARFAPAVYGAEGTGASVYVDDPEGNTVELKGPAAEPPLA
jgi:glyoxylase I family protein